MRYDFFTLKARFWHKIPKAKELQDVEDLMVQRYKELRATITNLFDTTSVK